VQRGLTRRARGVGYDEPECVNVESLCEARSLSCMRLERSILFASLAETPKAMPAPAVARDHQKPKHERHEFGRSVGRALTRLRAGFWRI